MKRIFFALLAIFSFAFSAWGLDGGANIYPAIFLDFEYSGGAIDSTNPAFYSRAPGIWGKSGYVGGGSVAIPSFSQTGGVDGHCCLDKTANTYWGGTFGPIRFGSSAVGYDYDIERGIDRAWSITVCGWYKTQPGKDIGNNGTLFYRSGQFQVLTPGSADTGKLAVILPANAGYNTGSIMALSATTVYSDPGNWVFFAVTYDGTKTTNNVCFYRGSIGSSVYLVSTATADAGQLIGGEHNEFIIGASGQSAGLYSTAGYLDKFSVYAELAQTSKGALNLQNLENVRRSNLGLSPFYSDALPGDADVDGDVDANDINIINQNINAGPIRNYYWADGDFDGNLKVDQSDLNIANSHYTGIFNTTALNVATISNKVKIQSLGDVTFTSNPQASLYAARGEHEGFQIAVAPVGNYRINNISVSAGVFTNETNSFTLPAESITIYREEKVRISTEIDNPYFDPMLDTNVGNAVPNDVLIFWIDFGISRKAVPGNYTGKIIVSSPDRPDVEVPVGIHVWEFAIPLEHGLQTSYNLFRQELRNVYGGDWNNPADPNYRKWLKAAIDHRVSPIDMSMYTGESPANRFAKVTKKSDGTWLFNFDVLDAYVDYAIANGASNFNMGDLYWHFWQTFYGYDEASGTYKLFDTLTSAEYEQVFAAYMTQAKEHFKDSGSHPYTKNAFFYAFDELNPSDSAALQKLITRHDIIESIWPQLNTLTTGEPLRYPSYENHLDIWAGKVPNYITYTQPKVDALRAKGNQFWLYVTGYAPPYCNLQINEPGIEHRMLYWQTFLYRTEGFLHWGLNVWPHYRAPNPWLTGMTAPAVYDRWPNRAWDDSGWLGQYYVKGGGYLMYPGLNGPLPSIRLEQMRDGIEDWEYLNILGKQKSANVWDGLIGRAIAANVSSSIISNAKTAADISSVVQSMTVYSSDPTVMENKRIQVGNAIDSLLSVLYTQKTADINGDLSIDFVDLSIMADQWLLSRPSLKADLDCSATVDFVDFAQFAMLYRSILEDTSEPIPNPQAYIPFENDNGTYGSSSTANPAWRNIVPSTPEAVTTIGTSSCPTYPRIGNTDGVKGSFEKITGYGTPGTDLMQTLSYKYNIVTDVMSQAKSYTVTCWINSRNSSILSQGKYIFHQQGGSGSTAGPALRWGYQANDGKIGVYAGGSFQYTSAPVVAANEWNFLAMTVDSTTGAVSLYKGTKTSAAVLVQTWTGLTIGQLPTLSANNSSTAFILNGWTYNGTDAYTGYDLDEFRLYSSKTDNTGALPLSQIEAIRKYDLR